MGDFLFGEPRSRPGYYFSVTLLSAQIKIIEGFRVVVGNKELTVTSIYHDGNHLTVRGTSSDLTKVCWDALDLSILF